MHILFFFWHHDCFKPNNFVKVLEGNYEPKDKKVSSNNDLEFDEFGAMIE